MRPTLSRRGFLALAATAGAAVACSPGAEPVASDKPVRGGRLRALFPGGGAKETLDPHSPPLFLDQARHKALFDKLVELGDDLRPVPKLAKSWESNVDATVWRFSLREAVFHDGRRLTPDDVLASLARMTDPAATGRNARTLLTALDLANSRAVDASTVELALKSPTAELPALLSGTGTAIVPADYGDPAGAIGTGPFSLVSFEAGRGMTAKRFDDHWNGQAHLDELHLLSAGDEAARGNALLAGEAEYVHDLSVTFARIYENDPAVTLLSAPGSVMQGFAMRTDQAPFDDPDVRLAFLLLVDRNRLVDVVLSGRGVVGNDLFGKGFQHYADDLPQRERDVARARELLRGAGVENLSVTLHTADAAAGMVDAATLYAEQLREAGITVTVDNRAKETYFADILTGSGIWSYRAGTATIPQNLALRMVSDAKQNVTAWRDPEFDAAFARAQSTVDETARGEVYRDMQRTLHERGGMLVWGHSDWLVAASPRLRGAVAARPNTDDWARFDKVWLA
ncbi:MULTISPECIES: ABC transporter substrate-binding protein [Actinosynnema]|uniref:ABC transporter substrate-binding protein n=1 Tax=Actinosynnema TaxID=40566 RepID=UPI0020A332C9|nr:ABC transporter substrate-binding protein [Actinosynnema pretiosum]MCP2098788.1 peptide/nickel transport system substrate-binding protein [Actinosynnema pretiosum]